MLPPGPHQPLTPRMPLPASPASSSHSSAPLFKEDKYSSTSEEESEEDEVTFIHGKSNGMFLNHQAKRPTSTPTTSDYTTQGDPDASPSNLFKSNDMSDEFLGTNNFFMPDGSNRWIHQIDNKVFHAGYLENSNNAYLLELPALENMLNTRKFLMDEMSGQFYAVYGNSYQRMSTKPMLRQAWATGDLIDELAATRQAFGYTGLTGSTPPLAMGMQPTASTSRQPDDLLPRQPAPKTVQYRPPSFKLTRLTTCLMMNERIQPSSSNKSTESSPHSSLPCGQRTPAALTSSSDAPLSQTPPQTFVHPPHQPKIPTHTQHTSPSPHKQHTKTPVKTNANQSSQSSIVEEDQQCVPKSADGTQVKHSKQQPRQQDECLCFHYNLPGHLKRNCPKIPYCPKCRTKGHTQDRCTNKSRRTRHTRQAGKSRDQQKRNEDLPQFSSRHNKCLQCAGDHQTTNCT